LDVPPRKSAGVLAFMDKEAPGLEIDRKNYHILVVEDK